MRAAIYARYSSDKQTDSIETQVTACEAVAKKKGLKVVEVFSDAAISGSTTARAGFQAMLASAKRREFEIVVIKDVSRFSRDLGALWRVVFDELPFYGVKVLDCQTGMYSDESAARTVYGALGQAADAYRSFVQTKTREGLIDRAEAGHWTGGKVYGYVTAPVEGTDRKTLVVHEPEAAVVRDVFARRAKGDSYKAIAHALNEAGIAPPRTGSKRWPGWGITTIRAMLGNETYRGVLRYNTRKWVKHPVTGKRVPQARPESEHVVQQRPDLAVINGKLWERVREAEDGKGKGKPWGAVKVGSAPNPLAGLARCGACGGPMVIAGQTVRNGKTHRSLRCANNVNRGDTVCRQKQSISLQKLVGGILAELTARAAAPDQLEATVAHAMTKLKARSTAKATVEQHAAKTKAAVARLAEVLAAVGPDPDLVAKYKAAKADAEEAERALAEAGVVPDENAVRAAVMRAFIGVLRDPGAYDPVRAREVLQESLREVRCTAGPARNWRIQAVFRDLPLSAVSRSSGGRI